jgi:uncharacterized protein YbgA (DUF1722 family)
MTYTVEELGQEIRNARLHCRHLGKLIAAASFLRDYVEGEERSMLTSLLEEYHREAKPLLDLIYAFERASRWPQELEKIGYDDPLDFDDEVEVTRAKISDL